jgi:hypothetical protein
MKGVWKWYLKRASGNDLELRIAVFVEQAAGPSSDSPFTSGVPSRSFQVPHFRPISRYFRYNSSLLPPNAILALLLDYQQQESKKFNYLLLKIKK